MTDNIEVADLIVTQNGLRFPIDELIVQVESGIAFDDDILQSFGMTYQEGRISPRIQLSQFEDGKIYIHDGHHRCTAICVAGRKFLYRAEYELKEWTYRDYYEPAYHNNWYLPFDPRTEVRHANLNYAKAYVQGRVSDIKNGFWEPKQLQDFLLRNSNLYKIDREKAGVSTVDQYVISHGLRVARFH